MKQSRHAASAEAPLIAHVIFRLDVGGLENGLVNLINAMPVDRYRHAIICIDRSSDFRKRIRRDDVEVVEIRKNPGHDLAAIGRIFKTIRRLRPAIVHTRNLAALDALLPALLAGVKHRIHGEHGWDVNDLQGASPKFRRLRKIYSPMVSRYVTVSRDLKDYLIDRVGVDARRVRHICNGVDTDRFSPNPNKLADRIGINAVFRDDTCVIGTVGRVEPVKDHRNLAAAFIKLVAEHPECAHARLAIVGDGVLRSTVLEILKDAGMEDYCWLPGRRDDVSEIIRCFDVFIQPSLAEGISNTVLEAMASGLPVIATDVGGNPELVEHGETGIIVPPADTDALVEAMRGYVSNVGLRDAHGDAGRKRVVAELSIERMLQNYLALYDATLA